MSLLYFASSVSSIGWTLVAQNDRGEVVYAGMADTRKQAEQDLFERNPDVPIVAGNSSCLLSTLGKLVAFVDDPLVDIEVPTCLLGTNFQRQVWQAIRQIPVGETASYADIANSVADRSTVRAVAQACGANPIALIVPCHRVVKSDGTTAGYRWGKERKNVLLAQEKRVKLRNFFNKPRSSAFAREPGEVHAVPMSVIQRLIPSELDEEKVQTFVQEMKVSRVVVVLSLLTHSARGRLYAH